MEIRIGEIVSTETGKIAVAHPYLIRDKDGNSSSAKNPMVKISPAIVNGKHCIVTNPNSNVGIVCFVPKIFNGCGIIRIEIRRVMEKSLFGVPVEYLQTVPWLEDYKHTGADKEAIYNKWSQISEKNPAYFVKWFGKTGVASC